MFCPNAHVNCKFYLVAVMSSLTSEDCYVLNSDRLKLNYLCEVSIKLKIENLKAMSQTADVVL